MKQSFHPSRKVVIIIAGFFFLFFVGMESFAFARAGGGRSSGSRGYSSGGSYQRTAPSQPRQQVMPQRPPVQQPQQPSAGRSFLSGLGGGLVGGMLGSMLFGGSGHAGGWGGGGGGGFGFGSLLLILIIIGAVYFIVKRFRAGR